MNSIQYALGEGHLTRHEEVLRMDYGNATCLMDCVKPNLVKVFNGFTTMRIVIDLTIIMAAFRWYARDVYLLT